MHSYKIIFYCLVGSSILSMVMAAASLNEALKGLVQTGNTVPSREAVPDKNSLAFPYYVTGYDYEDRPVIVMEWGRWDIRTLAEKGGDRVAKYEKGIDEFVKRVKSGYFSKKSNEPNPEDENETDSAQIAVVIDFEGLSLRQLGTPASVALFVRGLGKLEKVYKEFAYGYLLNSTPLVDQVINLSRPYMGKFLERCEVYGTVSRTWIPKILKNIPRSQLHSAYGGKKDFRPVAVYNIF
ncbi:unnamed protein product [Allacma fusca]|uniref:CRAL-TRIO domain-containing protein n=1 Tax=Allacma fusca TaxID=39272 RepID=A0A8J2KVN8_9HEXA|nr:unnamed protein product [Allacma fusca]